MRVHSTTKIRQLKKLRKRGYSINELVAALSIPKTTVWHHIRGVQVLPKYVDFLKAKQGGSHKRAQERWEKADQYARRLLASPKRDFAITLAMLYWGEGSKKVCEFINSDGNMIRCYLFILREMLGITSENIRATMRIFSGMDQSECLRHWSGATGFPREKFIVRFNDGGTRGRTKYGMCRITVKKGANTLKVIHSLINQLSNEIVEIDPLHRNAPVAQLDRAAHS